MMITINNYDDYNDYNLPYHQHKLRPLLRRLKWNQILHHHDHHDHHDVDVADDHVDHADVDVADDHVDDHDDDHDVQKEDDYDYDNSSAGSNVNDKI